MSQMQYLISFMNFNFQKHLKYYLCEIEREKNTTVAFGLSVCVSAVIFHKFHAFVIEIERRRHWNTRQAIRKKEERKK